MCRFIWWLNLVCFQALDTFNTAVVSPIYYALFTSFTILASVIMFKVLYHAHIHAHTHAGKKRVWTVSPFVVMSNHLSETLIGFALFLGLVWSKCKQHSLRALWLHHCFIWDCHIAQYQRARSTIYYRYISCAYIGLLHGYFLHSVVTSVPKYHKK